MEESQTQQNNNGNGKWISAQFVHEGVNYYVRGQSVTEIQNHIGEILNNGTPKPPKPPMNPEGPTKQPPSQAQLELLRKIGVDKIPANLDKTTASALIQERLEEINRRKF